MKINRFLCIMKRIQIHVGEIMISLSRQQVNTLLRNERSDVSNFNVYTNFASSSSTNEYEHNYISGIVDGFTFYEDIQKH